MTRPPLTDRMLDRADASFRDQPGALAQQLEDWAADPQPSDVDSARRAVDAGDDVLRRAHGADTFVLSFLGESYEENGHPASAHRWYTMGLTAAERHGDRAGTWSCRSTTTTRSTPTRSSTTSWRTASTSPPRPRP